MREEGQSFVSVLRSPVTQPFDKGKTNLSANFTKNGNCFEECNVLGDGKSELSAIKREIKVQILARKSAKLIANFCAKVTSLPSLSLSLSLSLSFSLSLYLSLSLSLTERTSSTV